QPVDRLIQKAELDRIVDRGCCPESVRIPPISPWVEPSPLGNGPPRLSHGHLIRSFSKPTAPPLWCAGSIAHRQHRFCESGFPNAVSARPESPSSPHISPPRRLNGPGASRRLECGKPKECVWIRVR